MNKRINYSQGCQKTSLWIKRMNSSEKSKIGKGRDLPWWVELLFVQIGLPDKFLIRILKAKKKSKELFKWKKTIINNFVHNHNIGLFLSSCKKFKNKLNCEAIKTTLLKIKIYQ